VFKPAVRRLWGSIISSSFKVPKRDVDKDVSSRRRTQKSSKRSCFPMNSRMEAIDPGSETSLGSDSEGASSRICRAEVVDFNWRMKGWKDGKMVTEVPKTLTEDTEELLYPANRAVISRRKDDLGRQSVTWTRMMRRATRGRCAI